jgi:hypothetical protein
VNGRIPDPAQIRQDAKNTPENPAPGPVVLRKETVTRAPASFRII